MQFLDDSSIRYVVVATADYPSRLKQWFKVLALLRKEKPAIVHIHLWRAMLFRIVRCLVTAGPHTNLYAASYHDSST